MRWDPWADLNRRQHVTFAWADLGRNRGQITRRHGRTIIYVHYRLFRREAEAALAHELVHEERGILFTRATPPAQVEIEERMVHRIVAERLVPPYDLDQRIRVAVRSDLEVTVGAVCEWYDTAEHVAELALQLAEQRSRQRHASGRWHARAEGIA